MNTTTLQSIDWQGQSGRKYTYWIYRLPPNFKAAPGNYIFAKEVSPGRWSPIYIGETENLSERFDSHHKAACIRTNAATHILAHRNDGGEAARKAEERDLVLRWKPICNG